MRYRKRSYATPEQQIAERVDRSGGPSACWPWTGTVGRNRYGYVRYRGRRYLAHRVALACSIGALEEGLDVLHSCDNPPCCNPAHLELGTASENARQMVARGRWRGPLGVANRSAKLTPDLVRMARDRRAAGATLRSIASDLGVSNQSIHDVVTRRSWRHVS